MGKIKIDVNDFMSKRNKFCKMLEGILGYCVNEEAIESRFNEDGKFELSYGRFGMDDQFTIIYMPYSMSSINLRIEANSKTYSEIRLRK